MEFRVYLAQFNAFVFCMARGNDPRLGPCQQRQVKRPACGDGT